MYCIKCGNELNDGTAFCPKCGTQQQAETEPAVEQPTTFQAEPMQSAAYTTSTASAAQTAAPEPPYNGLCIAGLVVSCVSILLNLFGLVSIAGIILSAMGVSASKKKGEKGRVLGIIGIVIGSIVVLFTIIVILLAIMVYDYNYGY